MQNPISEEPLYSLRELWACVKSKRRWIYLFAIVFSVWGAYFGMIRSVSYTAHATFKDRGQKQSASFGGGLSSLIVGMSKSDSEAASLMESRRLLDPLVKQYGLQVSGHTKTPSIWKKIQNNLKIEWAKFNGRDTVLLDLPPEFYRFRNVKYEGDYPLKITLQMMGEGTYEVFGPHEDSIGEGKIGHPFKCGDFCFTLYVPSGQFPPREELSLTIRPLDAVGKTAQGMVRVEVDKKDKTLLDLTMRHVDRDLTIHFLNDLMADYQRYLQTQHDLTTASQLVYLEERKDQVLSKQKKMMYAHAENLSETLKSSGFVDSQKVMDRLLTAQLDWVDRIQTISLEKKRLGRILDDASFCPEQALMGASLVALQPVLGELDRLKQTRDSLSLALQEGASPSQKRLSDQFSELEKIKLHISELEQVLISTTEGSVVDTELTVFHHPPYLLKTWVERVGQKAHSGQEVDSFFIYLTHLKRLLEVKRDIVQERLSYQYQADPSFQGLDLTAAQNIYAEYCHECNRIEAESEKQRFVLDQMKSPEFEINSLSSTLQDRVSQKMIERSSELALQLRGYHNRSEKELARIRDEMGIQKTFLGAHLVQTREMLDLSHGLLEEKMRSLQGVMLELTHQKISLLQKRAADFISGKICGLQQEEEMIYGHLKEVNQQMAFLPKQWVSEQLIQQSLRMDRTILEEVIRMVEGKNITHHMDVIQSSPIDQAHAPAFPNSPRILILAIVGAILGTFGSVSYIIGKEVIFGPGARLGNLEVLGCHISGEISKKLSPSKPLRKTDLQTLRRMNAFLTGSNTSLLFLGEGPNYTCHLAKITGEMGKRVLVLDLTFSKNEEGGILPFIEGENEEVEIIKKESFDFVPSGWSQSLGSRKSSFSSFSKVAAPCFM